MINCFIFFSDPLTVGKISELIKKINSEITLFNILDVGQFDFDEIQKDNTMLISSGSNLDLLSDADIATDDFHQIYVIDDVEDEVVGNITYVNKKFILVKIGTLIDEYVKEILCKDEFVPISINKLKTNLNYPCEIFIKLSAKKHIKILNDGHHFNSESLQKLIFKNVEFLYIRSSDYNTFCTVFTDDKTDNKKKVDIVNTEINALEAIHNYMEDLGFSSKVIDMTKTLHTSIEEKYNHKFMKKLFNRFKDMEGTFLYNHSYLASVIALTAGNKFNWMNHENKEKIYLGCILHDLGFKHKENALRESLLKNEVSKLSVEEKEDILDHPMKFAKHLAQIDNIHQDVIKIVRDHHGVHGDQSYPKPIYPAEINLIFALFVLSHELSIGLYSISFNEKKIPALLNSICEKFDKGNYKKVLPEFKTAVEEIFIKSAA